MEGRAVLVGEEICIGGAVLVEDLNLCEMNRCWEGIYAGEGRGCYTHQTGESCSLEGATG